jgi:hypothetical protein
LFFLIVLVAVGLCGYGLYLVHLQTVAERKAEEAGEKPVESRHFALTNELGEMFISLDAEQQNQFGIKTEPLRSITYTNEIQTFGVVMDVSPLVSFLLELNNAKIALELARRQYEREKNLYDSGKNTPLKNVEAALAEVKKNEEQIRAIKNKLSLQWGGTIDVEKIELFLKPFIDGKKTLVRISLLPEQKLNSAPAVARLAFVGEPNKYFTANFFSMPSVVEAGELTRSYIYSIEGTNLPVGLKLEARLTAPENVIVGVFVPDEAIVRAFGKIWAYKKIGDGQFQRFPVIQALHLNNGVIVTNGWKAGDVVVSAGAAMLLSEELKSQIRLVE